jgi:uncharacterized Zn-binding protein involved in type VI secretion
MFSPAARLTDMHACPMQTPAVVPIPHVGGPIVSPGATTVTIGGLPAARVTDICICVGPPAPIVLGSMTVQIEGLAAARVGDMTAHGGSILPPGCPTVLIGDAGGGAGTAAFATMLAARSSGAAFVRTNCDTEAVVAAASGSPLFITGDPTKTHFVEIELFDQKNRPVPHVRFRVVPPGANAKPIEGFLDEQGFVRISGIDAGTCKITFPDLDASSWKPDKGDPGRRINPEPPLPSGKRPGVRASSVILEVAVRPPGVKAASVQLARLNVPTAGRPGVIASTVVMRVIQLRPGIQAATVTLKVVSGAGKFVSTLPKPSESVAPEHEPSTDRLGDLPPLIDDEGLA